MVSSILDFMMASSSPDPLCTLNLQPTRPNHNKSETTAIVAQPQSLPSIKCLSQEHKTSQQQDEIISVFKFCISSRHVDADRSSYTVVPGVNNTTLIRFADGSFLPSYKDIHLFPMNCTEVDDLKKLDEYDDFFQK